MKLQIRMLAILIIEIFVIYLTDAQLPSRLHIPEADSVPIAGTRSHFRRSGGVRDKQHLAAINITPRIIEESKPVTESADDELPDVYLPQLLREQQLSNAQQMQFQQTVEAFLNGEPNTIAESPLRQLVNNHNNEALLTTPQYSTRLSDRTLTQSTSNPKNIFNDFSIGPNLVGGSHRYVMERNQITNVAIPISSPVSLPANERINVIRSRSNLRDHRPLFDNQPVPTVTKAKPKPKPTRLTIEQNQLQDNRFETHSKRKRPVAQTIRKWREENDDGSITWGYENDDGSFKEELIGTDCITKGTYGYIDPDGNKREYHYETGIKCDPNTRTTNSESQENGFINYEENRAILPNGIEIDMSQLGKKKSRRPLVNSNYRT